MTSGGDWETWPEIEFIILLSGFAIMVAFAGFVSIWLGDAVLPYVVPFLSQFPRHILILMLIAITVWGSGSLAVLIIAAVIAIIVLAIKDASGDLETLQQLLG